VETTDLLAFDLSLTVVSLVSLDSSIEKTRQGFVKMMRSDRGSSALNASFLTATRAEQQMSTSMS
jgi:hypothetical protein